MSLKKIKCIFPSKRTRIGILWTISEKTWKIREGKPRIILNPTEY
jgi:hypothetical protein